MPPTTDRRSGRLAIVLAISLLGGLLGAGAVTVSAAAPLPSCAVADTLTLHRALSDWPRSLLDSRYRLASTYAPTDLRSTADAGLNGGQSVRKLVIADLKAMASAARAAGARLAVQSAYRSYATQQATFDYWVDLHGYEYALKESARAGHSEHQLGTSLDFKSYGGPAPWDVTDWATTKAGKWMKANAWKYGFILSYPKGKTDVTCYMYEPWHYRYVGRDRAIWVRASGLTLREFLWAEQTRPKDTLLPGGSPRP
jgi:D-alanyl-D-alanine carboxypeptidase